MQKGGGLSPNKIWTKYSSLLLERLRNDKSFLDGSKGPPDRLPYFFSSDQPVAEAERYSKAHKYAEWIARSYIDGGIRQVEDIQSRVYPEIEYFNTLVRKKRLSTGTPGQPWTNENILENFCGLVGCNMKGRHKAGLSDLIDKHREFLDSLAATRDVQVEGKSLYEDVSVKIYQPKTEVESCHYGRGTRWCTAATKGANMFDHYSKEGELYILVPKKPTHKGEKYQLQFESSQYMNELDHPEDLLELIVKFPLILKIFQCVYKAKNLFIYKKGHNYIVLISEPFTVYHFNSLIDEDFDEYEHEDYVTKDLDRWVSSTTGSIRLLQFYNLFPMLLSLQFKGIVNDEGVLYTKDPRYYADDDSYFIANNGLIYYFIHVDNKLKILSTSGAIEILEFYVLFPKLLTIQFTEITVADGVIYAPEWVADKPHPEDGDTYFFIPNNHDVIPESPTIYYFTVDNYGEREILSTKGPIRMLEFYSLFPLLVNYAI